MATDLKAASKNIYDLFGKLDADGLGAAMAPNCVLKRVLNPDSIFGGVATIVSYLKYDMFVPKPTFTTDLAKCNYHPVAQNDQDTAVYGHVRGIGMYQDKAANAAIPVAFVWSFTRAAAGGDWLLVSVFGAPTDNANF